MKTLTIHIKNMVCLRCIHVVKQILNEFSIYYIEVKNGYAIIEDNQFSDLDALDKRLQDIELGLVENENEILIGRVNSAIGIYLENIHRLSREQKLSEYLAQDLAKNYHQLSKGYSHYAGMTIEQYFIKLRTEKVKELIKQGKLNFSQIAITLGYSGIHYLSGQFRKTTGLSLSEYKKHWKKDKNKAIHYTSTGLPMTSDICSCGGKCRCENTDSKQRQGKEIPVVTEGMLSENLTLLPEREIMTASDRNNVYLNRY